MILRKAENPRLLPATFCKFMLAQDINLTRFFAWARARALAELEARLTADPQLDPNWTFSDIMQELLAEYRQQQRAAVPSDLTEPPPKSS
jgi:hypothetical protein